MAKERAKAKPRVNKEFTEHVIKLGERISTLRLEKEMSQLDLAVKVDIDPTALRRYEKGRTEMGFTILIKFAEVFELSVDELLGLDKKKSK
jgi:transcriptional regulator with XRE-family HTH domain